MKKHKTTQCLMKTFHSSACCVNAGTFACKCNTYSEPAVTTCNCGVKHVTLKEFQRMNPYSQGYTVYMQAEHPGSELKKHQDNPYVESTPKWEEFNNGSMAACLVTQDSED